MGGGGEHPIRKYLFWDDYIVIGIQMMVSMYDVVLPGVHVVGPSTATRGMGQH